MVLLITVRMPFVQIPPPSQLPQLVAEPTAAADAAPQSEKLNLKQYKAKMGKSDSTTTVEFRLAERRSHFILHHLGFGSVAHNLLPVFDGPGSTNFDSNG